MIVGVLSEKGGTGKTTLATNLAGMRAGLDRRVLLIDADPQGSALHWIELRGADLPRVEVLPLDGPQLSRHLRTRTMQHDDVIIDVGAGVTDDLIEAMAAADCVVVPVQPTGMDVWTMTLIDHHVGEALSARPEKRALAVINRASANPRHLAATQTRSALVAGCRHMRPVEEMLCDRVAFQRAYTAGQTVLEYVSTSDRAAGEIAALYAVVFNEPYPGTGSDSRLNGRRE